MLVAFSVFWALALAGSPALAQASGWPDDIEVAPAEYYSNIRADTSSAVLSSVDDAGKAESLAEWTQMFGAPNACWGCVLYEKMQEVTRQVGKQGEALFTEGAITAMNAFMAVWVTFQLYLLLSPTHANSPSQSINTIFQRIVLMMVVLAVLKAGPYELIMERFVFEIIDDIMVAGQALVGGSGSSCGVASPGAELICSMHMEMGRGLGLGAFLTDDAQLGFWPGADTEFFQFFGGIAMFIAFAWMMIMLPFRLFDALIRLAVVSIILPVVILAYQFKPTRGACKQAVTSVLAAALTFLFTAIAVAISVRLLNAVAGPVLSSVNDSSPDAVVGPLGAKEFMVLIAAALGMASFIKQAGSVASEFAGFQGSMGDGGGGGATAVAGAAAGAAGGAGYVAAKGGGFVGGLAGKGAKKAGGAVMNKLRPGKAAMKAAGDATS